MTLIQDHVEADAFHKEFLTGGMCGVGLREVARGERGRKREGERGRVS